MNWVRVTYAQRDVDVGVRELRMHGVVQWLNAAAAADRGTVGRSTRPVRTAVLFVFTSCVVLVAQQLTTDKKKIKVPASRRQCYGRSSVLVI